MEHFHTLYPRDANQAPMPLTKLERNPTLIVSWWCTIFSLVVILIRTSGRWIRTERLFREDKIMLLSIIPLLIRMAFIHPVLLWGTNNVQISVLTVQEIQDRAIGSRLVLGARIWYAVYIWVAKIAVLEFVQKIISKSWTKFYQAGAKIMYAFLAITLVAVIVATLAECRPFTHYWQVTPDPGPSCRIGAAQLITMGACDIVSDVALIVFPIPLVMMSKMPLSKKVSLTLLFLLSLILIAVTSYRMPAVINRHYSQQFRSLMASLEILAATCVSNGIVIGSFLRDKGVKKRKFRAGSMAYTDDEEAGSLSRPATRTLKPSVTQKHWGSDEDLVRGLGLTVSHELRYDSARGDFNRLSALEEVAPDHRAPSPVITPSGPGMLDPSWNFRKGSGQASDQRRQSNVSTDSEASSEFHLQEMKPYKDEEEEDAAPSLGPESPYRKMNFFDVGGLVDLPASEESSLKPQSRRASAVQPTSRSGQNFIADIGGLLDPAKQDSESSAGQSTGGFRQSLSLLSQRKQNKGPDRSFFSRNAVAEDDESSETSSIPRKRSSMTAQRSSVAPMPRHPSGPDELGFSDAGGLLK